MNCSASAERPSISRSCSGCAIGVRRIRAVREIVLETERKLQLIEVTDEIREALGQEDGMANGATAALIYVPHTTAGVAINERIDPELVTDLENAFQRVVGDDWDWTHEDEDGPNAPSHARASLASSPQVLIPLKDGGLALGTYQGVFFCEFDGPRTRKIYVTTLR
jgi:secondary thiamine-phosphate synthase enzyme